MHASLALFIAVTLSVAVKGNNLKGKSILSDIRVSSENKDAAFWENEYDLFIRSLNNSSSRYQGSFDDIIVENATSVKRRGRRTQAKLPAGLFPALPVARTIKCPSGINSVQFESDGWFTTTTNTKGKWTISSNRAKLRFDIEDTNCGGSGTAAPNQGAWAYVWMRIDCAVKIDVTGSGKVSVEEDKVDYLNVFMNQQFVYQLSSEVNAEQSDKCQMGNPFERKKSTGVSVLRGTHQLAVQFASNAAKFHNNAFYEIEFSFV
jgi:hypothetical protein